ncbi:hypothetical protein FF1_044015 [Malus domestica]
MVCQAASQTRFRALKHENGIDGSATIIVRVIACFQPLQDCQVVVLVGWVRILEPGFLSSILAGNHPIRMPLVLQLAWGNKTLFLHMGN